MPTPVDARASSALALADPALAELALAELALALAEPALAEPALAEPAVSIVAPIAIATVEAMMRLRRVVCIADWSFMGFSLSSVNPGTTPTVISGDRAMGRTRGIGPDFWRACG